MSYTLKEDNVRPSETWQNRSSVLLLLIITLTGLRYFSKWLFCQLHLPELPLPPTGQTKYRLNARANVLFTLHYDSTTVTPKNKK